MNIFVVFLTGLTVGGLTCVLVQGGLLASLIAEREKEEAANKEKIKTSNLTTYVFLLSKLLVYTFLGFLLGLVGNAISITDQTQTIIQFIAGVYILAIALNLLNVHPIFRYAVIQPPKFFTKKIRSQSKSKDIFAPAILGAMTVFMPCGTTLAMEALAISSGNAFSGALIMFSFILGTIPLFLGLGWITSILGETFKVKFIKITAIALIYLSFVSINASLTVWNLPISFENLKQYAGTLTIGEKKEEKPTVQLVNGVQNVEINVYPNKYSPNYFKVQSGVPVKLDLIVRDGIGCTSSFRIPELEISKNLYASGAGIVEFTPIKKGRVVFTCSMGMYSGIMEVI